MIQIVLDKRLKRADTMQIVDQLKHYFVESSLIDGALFPDYQAVAVANQINASLVKSAYDQMVSDGYLINKKSRYTVRRLPFIQRFDGTVNTLFETIQSMGMTPSFKTQALTIIEQLPLPFTVNPMEDRKKYIQLNKIYYADQIPVSYAHVYCPLDLVSHVSDVDLKTLDVMNYLEKTHGLKFAHYHQTIDVIHPGPIINTALEQPLNASVFRMHIQIMDAHRDPYVFYTLYTSILYSLETIHRLR